MLMEAMGLHIPGSAFIHPHDGTRKALTEEAVKQLVTNINQEQIQPRVRAPERIAIGFNISVSFMKILRSCYFTTLRDGFDLD